MSADHDLERRLRGLGRIDVPDPVPARPIAIAGRRRRIRQGLVAGSLAVVVLVGAVVVLDREGSEQSDVVTVPEPETDPTVASTTTSIPAELPLSQVSEVVKGEVPPDPMPAISVVTTFLARLRSDDLVGASELWSGYPGLGSAEERTAALEQLREDWPWVIERPEVGPAVEAAGFGHEVVVSVLGPPEDHEGDRAAAAFVLSGWVEPRIERLPSRPQGPTPSAGSTVRPGQTLLIPGRAVEGGARVSLAGRTFDAVPDDDGWIRIRIPDDARTSILVVASFASPELPTAAAYWFPVEDP